MTNIDSQAERKRRVISWAYPGDAWLERVKKMSAHQVHTVYMRLLNNNQLKGIKDNVNYRKSGEYRS